MARPIRETPILYGGDARKFEARMKNPPKESKNEALSCSHECVSRLKRMAYDRGRVSN